ncbi:tRNA uridine-5-carboxymethylaminomethyl(34) synthesis GTPase MnmE [Sphingomonas flavalba]|uniref:tRNA uridine-5-carboxymethylaminomethyl(34) synthesis GTPase MnmE n=1 Tax=Sphingomonas flavalba TaxID=2559804 RepID=UPI001EEFB811|nr:tRNA uridine-5-carboxymethylaminomethyl(34) synthesis GTPase MnmE [Sphingomonas flavalba]
MPRQTIFALSSGAPPAAIAVVRVSGPGAVAAAVALTGQRPEPRRARLARIADPDSGLPIDRGLLLFFPGPRSVTGEDLVEFHLHGGRAVIAAVERALATLPGLRPARAGEFTWRAFQNGKTDLIAVEGLSDLLRAETEAQRRRALAVAEGGLTARIDGWQKEILIAGALIESRLDFSDEDDVDAVDTEPMVHARLSALQAALAAQLARPPAERLRDGLSVVIAGPPNAGKSTLLNRLVEREAAIVSAIAGTTRDLIEVPVVLGGVAYRLTDTAGLRAGGDDPIERIGIDRAAAAIADADIVLWLGDGPPADGEQGQALLHLHPRADLPGRAEAPPGRLALSAATGGGIAELIAAMGEVATTLLPRADELALSRRQREAVATVAEHVVAALTLDDDLLRAEHLRLARACFDALTGRAGTEDMLDALFGTFCIGK